MKEKMRAKTAKKSGTGIVVVSHKTPDYENALVTYEHDK
jgi:hypothetical protein